jgi:hypothetical protein
MTLSGIDVRSVHTDAAPDEQIRELQAASPGVRLGARR